MTPWLGGGDHILLGLILGFILLRIGSNDLLVPLRVVADDEARVGQGHADLSPHVGAESGASDLVGLGKVDNVIQIGVHWRVAVSGAPWRSCCIRMVGLKKRDWRGFRFGGRAAERGRLGGGEAVNNA